MIAYVEAEGTPGQIGMTVGSQLSDLLQEAQSIFMVGFADGEHWSRFQDALGPYIAASQETLPDVVAELEGMAEGSGVPFDVLFAMNSRQEVGFELRGCSSLAVPPEGTRNGHVLLAHNEDTLPALRALTYVVHGRPSKGPEYLAFTYSGLLLHQGLNARGIGQVGNALYANDLSVGIPKLLAYRDVMYADTLESAIMRCIRPERANGNNHILADRDGESYDVEVSGRNYSLIYGGKRFLAHTNHFVTPELARLERTDLINSRLRLNRLTRLLDREYGDITVESLVEALSDHANYPRSICKHEQAGVNETVATIASVVIDLTDGVLWVAQGNPCENEFQEFWLGG